MFLFFQYSLELHALPSAELNFSIIIIHIPVVLRIAATQDQVDAVARSRLLSLKIFVRGLLKPIGGILAALIVKVLMRIRAGVTIPPDSCPIQQKRYPLAGVLLMISTLISILT